jgi:hypothetical protein
LAAAIPALANTEIAATRVFSLWTSSFMGACLAAPCRTRKRGIAGAIATYSQSSCELF